MVQSTCLSDEEISAYLRGLLSESESASFEDHLQGCARCESCLADLEESGDWLTRHLTLAPEQSVNDTRWQGCLDRLREIPIREPSAPSRVVAESKPRMVYHYVLGPRIGQGGMGVVYQSHHPQLHRPVAIKLLSATRATEAAAIGRFQREMRAAGSLDHPGIVRALDAGVWEGTYYFVMEYIDGIDLSRLVHRCGPLAVADACAVIVRAAEALQYAHEHQVLHRDIKPSNLILTRDGSVKILDFGLARVEHGDLHGHEATTMGRLIGTLDYLSPEQASGSLPVDERSDVYGLGATLYRLLTGKPPHGLSSNVPLMGYLKRLTEEEAPSVNDARADVAKPVADIITQLIACRCEDRPRSAGEVAELLAPYCAGSSLETLAHQSIVNQPIDVQDAGTRTLVQSPSDAASAEPDIGPRRGSNVGLHSVLVGVLGILVGLGSLTFWLNSGEGTIKIESEVDEVSLQLVENGEVAESIEVKPGDDSVSVRVGKYVLRLEGNVDSVRMDTEVVTLMRGDTRVVRITREADAKPSAAETLSPTRTVQAHLDRLDAEWALAKEKFGERHPQTEAARASLLKAKQEILSAVTGEEADARTNRGRTYRQWSDIVLRETEPKTVTEGVWAITELSSKETHQQTLETLLKVATWNESRSERPSCADYIAMLNMPRFRPNSDGTMRPITPTAEQTRWKTHYDWPSGYWQNLTAALVASLEKLPVTATVPKLLESVNGDESTAAQNIALMLIAKAANEASASDRAIVRELLRSGASPEVRAFAWHVWIRQLSQDPASVLDADVLSAPQSIRKSIVVTSLLEERIADGVLMGRLAAGLMIENVSIYHRLQISDFLTKLVSDPDSLRPEEKLFVEHVARQTVRRLATSPKEVAASVQSLQFIRALACANLLDEELKVQASERLHAVLSDQVAQRSKLSTIHSYKSFDELPVLLSAMTLVALDGKIPKELVEATLGDSISQELEELRASLFSDAMKTRLQAFQYLFPVQTGRMVLRACSESLGKKDAAGGWDINAYRSVSRVLQGWDEALLFAIFESESSDPELALALGRALERLQTVSRSELQLSLPLASFSDQMLSIALQEPLSGQGGFALRLAQLGGADSDQVFQIATSRLAEEQGEETRKWRVSTVDFSWLLECLAQKELRNRVEAELYDSIVDRLLNESFTRHSEATLTRCYISALEIRREQSLSDNADTLVGLAIGARSKRNFAWLGNRRNAGSREWQLVASYVPQEIVQAALESIIANPPLDEEILINLESKRNRLNQFGLKGPVLNLVNEAVTKISEAMEEA